LAIAGFQEALAMTRFIEGKNMITEIVLSAVVFISGCGIAPVSVKYTSATSARSIVVGAPEVRLHVEDAREKKVFFRTILGENDDEGKKGMLRLITPPEKVFEEGFTQALQSAGYQVREDADVLYEVRIKRFLADDPQKSPHYLESDIVLEVLIKRYDQVLARKTIFERDTEKMTFGQAWQHVIPRLLNRSLSQAIEKAVEDKDLIAALGAGRTIVAKTPDKKATALTRQQYAPPAIPRRGSLSRVEPTRRKRQTVPRPTSAVTEYGARSRIPDSDFVISVIRGLPHRFPEGEVKGLWLSSVPSKPDVFAFPKGYSGKFKVFSDFVMNEADSPYYLGKTPLLAKLRKGTYDILFVHPPIGDGEYVPQYRNRYLKPSGIKVSEPVSPFVAHRKPAVYAVQGVLYFTEEREIEVRSEDAFETAIVLFQREDQTVADILDSAPVDENFSFSSVHLLRDPNGLARKIDELMVEFDAELSSQEAGAKPSFPLSQEEVAQAETMLRRIGVWTKKFSDTQTLAIEAKPNGTDWFTLRYPLTIEGRRGMTTQEFAVKAEPDSKRSRVPTLVVADAPARLAKPHTRSDLPEVQPSDSKSSQKTKTVEALVDRTDRVTKEELSYSEQDADFEAALAIIQRAEFLSKQGRDDAALALFEQALDITDNADLIARTMIGIGNFLSSDGRADEAEDFYSQAGDLAIDPDVKARVLLAQVGYLCERKRYREAREKAKEAQDLATSPETNALALVTSAALCVGEGNVEEGRRQFVRARTHLHAAFQIANSHLEKAQLKNAIAMTFMTQGKYDEAIAELQEATRVTDDDGFRSTAFLGIGACSMMQRNWMDAHKALHEALALASDADTKSMALIALGELSERQGNHDGALAKYTEALQAGGSQNQVSYAFFKQGMALARLGRFDEALDSFEEVLELAKSINRKARALNNIGIILRQRGDRRGAKAKFEKALKYATRPSVRKQILQNL
jgi:tetratricopeptide (TPR) repeat protein